MNLWTIQPILGGLLMGSTALGCIFYLTKFVIAVSYLDSPFESKITVALRPGWLALGRTFHGLNVKLDTITRKRVEIYRKTWDSNIVARLIDRWHEVCKAFTLMKIGIRSLLKSLKDSLTSWFNNSTPNDNNSINELWNPVLGDYLSLKGPEEMASALAIQWAALASTDPEMWPTDCPQLHPLVKWLSVIVFTHEDWELCKEVIPVMCAVERPPAVDFQWSLDYGVRPSRNYISYGTKVHASTPQVDIEWWSHLVPYYIMENIDENSIVSRSRESKVSCSERCLTDSSPIVMANGALALALHLGEQVERSLLTIKDKSEALDYLLERLALKLPEYQPATQILMSLQQENSATIFSRASITRASIIRVFTDFLRGHSHRYTDTQCETLLQWALDIFSQCRSLQQNPNFDKAILGFIVSLDDLMGPYQPHDWMSSFVHCQLDAQWKHILEYSLTVPEEDHEAIADSFCLLGTINWTGKDLPAETLENLMARITRGLATTQPQSVRHTALTATCSLRFQIMKFSSESVCRQLFGGLLTSIQYSKVEDADNKSDKTPTFSIQHSCQRQLFFLRILPVILKDSNIAPIVTKEHIASALSGIGDCMNEEYYHNQRVSQQGLSWTEAFSHGMAILSMILNLDSWERNLDPSTSTISRAWEIFYDSFHAFGWRSRNIAFEKNALIALHNTILDSIHLVSVYTQQSIKARPTGTTEDLTWLLDCVKDVRGVLEEYNEVRNEDMETLVEIRQQFGVLTGIWTQAHRDLDDTLSVIEEQTNAQLQAQ
ncbi:hypothetical protein M422DRAFT_67968 [Sphaerobolus stellatus SS14]|uniref:Uncharacterized protein n=1 Tax=Sphaerobolus stellatus (strain SS14) TaxID=990650 RepID=A0A0C9VWF3_SPHS4|nr:hypothetical protein M422DRAFT_67968 [Sphaerobolus stellatus SS14]